MDYVTAGSTGVQVSPLCLGTMSFGDEADEDVSAQMFHRARKAGINFFDTADVYGQGASEEILGKLVSGSRDEAVIASKVFFPTGQDVNARGLSRRHIARAVEASLARLGTEWIDFYFVHTFDELTPIEETLGALDDLQRQGKIRYPAVSNWAAWQIAMALGISAREHLARFELIEPMYNLVRRQAEVEILPLAEAQKMGVVTYSPLGGGLLTGKYGTGKRPGERAAGREPPVRRPVRPADRLRHRGSFHGVRAGDRRHARDPRGGVGDVAPGRDRADHRRAESCPAGGLPDGPERRDDRRAAGEDLRAVPGPAPGDRPDRNPEAELDLRSLPGRPRPGGGSLTPRNHHRTHTRR